MKHLLVFALAVCLVISAAHTQTWVSLNGPQIASSVRDISVTNSGVTVYSADNSYVLKSSNSGSGWFVTGQAYSSPLLVLVKPDDSSKVLAAKNGELRYNDAGGAGNGWSTISGLTDLTPLRLVAAANNNAVMLLGRMFVSGNSAIWRSGDGGSTWNKVTQFEAPTDIHDFAPYPRTGDNRDSIVLAVGSAPSGSSPQGEDISSTAANSGLWVSTNLGVEWEPRDLGDRNIISVAIIPKSSGTDYIRFVVENPASGNDIVRRATSLSNPEWTNVFSSAEEVRMVRVKRVGSTAYSVFLATSSGVYRSTNEGTSWTQQNTGMGTDLNVLSIAFPSDQSNSTIIAGTAHSLYKSTNNGDTWTEVGKMNVTAADGAAQPSGQSARTTRL